MNRKLELIHPVWHSPFKHNERCYHLPERLGTRMVSPNLLQHNEFLHVGKITSLHSIIVDTRC